MPACRLRIPAADKEAPAMNGSVNKHLHDCLARLELPEECVCKLRSTDSGGTAFFKTGDIYFDASCFGALRSLCSFLSSMVFTLNCWLNSPLRNAITNPNAKVMAL
ncbi:hypothetical protein NDU88_003969 [Pleurodeles waltl]|uniref:Uncharacterized protein n=1 Tax=Pleurodeles waltl TaxID=8319 RepID=A0AAV7VHB7_PLEWA|nr:hypothetical protein NDU88_003969 [Pleurodeles waltl]